MKKQPQKLIGSLVKVIKMKGKEVEIIEYKVLRYTEENGFYILDNDKIIRVVQSQFANHFRVA